MSKSSKSTKVPMMRDDLIYSDWKKELAIWEYTNIVRGVDKSVLAGELFESLKGKPRSTVLSELKLTEITHADGVQNILKTLDTFFEGNKVKNAFQANDELMKYKRPLTTNCEDFLVEFQMKVNKVKASGTAISDGVLGYTLLNAANLTPDKSDMIRATCDVLNFKTVKAQIEKIGIGQASSSSNNDTMKFTSPKFDNSSTSIKVEQNYYGQYDSDSSDDAQIASFYSNQFNSKRGFKSKRYDYQTQCKFPLNPSDKYGHTLECKWCHCIYHFLLDCPYAPEEVKNEVAQKQSRRSNFSAFNSNNNSKKPL